MSEFKVGDKVFCSILDSFESVISVCVMVFLGAVVDSDELVAVCPLFSYDESVDYDLDIKDKPSEQGLYVVGKNDLMPIFDEVIVIDPRKMYISGCHPNKNPSAIKDIIRKIFNGVTYLFDNDHWHVSNHDYDFIEKKLRPKRMSALAAFLNQKSPEGDN